MKDGYFQVGTTQSGKKFYISFIENLEIQMDELTEIFSYEEIFDAYAMLQVISLKEYRRQKNSRIEFFEDFSERIKTLLSKAAVFDEIMNSKRLNTSIDIVNYATPLVLRFIRESIN